MKFNRIDFKRIRWCTCVFLLWAVIFAPVGAQSIHFPMKPKKVPGDTSVPVPVDPARCSKGDKKYIYWAAKEQVFRIPFDPLLPPIYAIPDRDLSGWSLQARQEIPPPPDPKEPEGCYGNPFRGLSMPYFRDLADRVYQDLIGRPPSGTGMHHSGSADAWETEFGPGFWPRMYSSSSPQRPFCQSRPSGIQMCLMTSNQDPNTFNPAHLYIIPRSLLPSYIGNRDLRVIAGVALSSSSNSPEIGVESNFKLFGNVLIRLSPRVKPDEIDLMVPYHIKLIQHVIDAHVSDYDWHPHR